MSHRVDRLAAFVLEQLAGEHAAVVLYVDGRLSECSKKPTMTDWLHVAALALDRAFRAGGTVKQAEALLMPIVNAWKENRE